MKYGAAAFLGVDIGTSSIAVVAVDERGRMLKCLSEANPSACEPSADGRHEQDPEAMRETAERLVGAVEEFVRASGREIAGVGWTGQMHGLVAVDRDLHPLTPFVTWRDRRAAPPQLGCGIMEDWRRRGVKGVYRALTIPGYVIARRTGRCVVDATFRASMGSEKGLRKFAKWIPDADEALMLGDNQAGVLAVERLKSGAAVVNIGTSGQLSRVCSDGADADPLAAGLERRPFRDGKSLVCRASHLGGAALARLRESLGISWKRLNDEAESDVRIAECVAAIVDDIAVGTNPHDVKAVVGIGNAIRKNPCLVKAVERRFHTKCIVPEVDEMAAWGAALNALERISPQAALNRTKRASIAETLRHEILLGKYAVGSRFPSEHMLMRRFGVARSTVTQALSDLKQDGILRSMSGSGSYVTPLAKVKGSIGIIVPDRGMGEIFDPICRAIRREVVRLGYEVIFQDALNGTADERKANAVAFARRCAEDHVAGVVMEPIELVSGKDETTAEMLSVLKAINVPVVLIDRDVVPSPGRSGYDLVGIDNFLVGYMACEHMVKCGARRIAFVAFRNSAPTVARRINGVAQAAIDGGIGWGRRNAVEIDFGDANALVRLMRGRNPPDAIVCGNDCTAAFVERTLDEVGFSVPDDVMVSGFDDIAFAKSAKVPLTTFRQPCDDIGRVAIRTLVERILHPDLPPRQILLAAEMVERLSTDRTASGKNTISNGKETGK